MVLKPSRLALGLVALMLAAAAAHVGAASAATAAPAIAAKAAPTKASLQAATAPKYTVRQVDSSDLMLEPPDLPDLAPYTDEAVLAKVPKQGAAKVEVKRFVEANQLHEFTGGAGRLGEWAARQRTHPVAVFIDGGTMTAAGLAKALPKEFP